MEVQVLFTLEVGDQTHYGNISALKQIASGFDPDTEFSMTSKEKTGQTRTQYKKTKRGLCVISTENSPNPTVS